METGTALARIQNKTSEDMLAIAEGIEDGYTYQIRHFVKWARTTGHGIDEDGIKGYFAFLDSTNYTANTIRNKRSAVKRRVRQLFHDAPLDDRMRIDRVLSDLEHDDPAPKINSVQVTRDRCLDAGEYRELLLHCRSDRQRAFVRFLNTTGARVSELCGIRLDQAEALGSAVKLRLMGKGRKERFVRIPSELFAFIRETFAGSVYLFETSNGKPYGREYVSAQIATIGRRIDRRISAHTLRHSFATRKVNQLPGKLDAVSRYLGHSSPSITLAMYCHSSMSDAELFDIDEAAL
jgi:integrase/recombinase XerD